MNYGDDYEKAIHPDVVMEYGEITYMGWINRGDPLFSENRKKDEDDMEVLAALPIWRIRAVYRHEFGVGYSSSLFLYPEGSKDYRFSIANFDGYLYQIAR